MSAEPLSVRLWVGFRAAYLTAYHADRMMRAVVHVSVQASMRSKGPRERCAPQP
jgi:hypothetical protein